MDIQNAKVHIMPNCDDCGRLLDRWQSESDAGVTVVTCIPKIQGIGYEMRARRIPSQLMPLDYPSCGSHWASRRIPAGIDERRLVQIAASNGTKA
jgi:hypothetical protein